MALAPVYYAYGSACLLQVEHSANIFGDAVKHKQEKVRIFRRIDRPFLDIGNVIDFLGGRDGRS